MGTADARMGQVNNGRWRFCRLTEARPFAERWMCRGYSSS